VAEQLAFEKRLGNRGAVDRDEWIGGAAAGGVNSARKKLLPGPRFPDEEYGDRTACSDLRGEVYRIAEC
jgi:hypothetical protein